MHEHRLGLVVTIVPHGDGARSDLPGNAGQESVTDLASDLFQGDARLGSQRGHIHPLHSAEQLPGCGGLAHEGCVSVRFGAANPVVEMCHVKLKPVFEP